MAKKAKILHNEKRMQLVERYRQRREELRANSLDMNLTQEEREEARRSLSLLPKNSSATRIRKRCLLTGRPRGIVGQFGVSRIKFRELALQGVLPGVTKSSW